MNTRTKLLNAAQEMLLQRGIARMTVRDIAVRAGVSDGALYTHFSGKDELIVTLLNERLFEPGYGLVPQGINEKPVREGLIAIIERSRKELGAALPLVTGMYARPDLLARMQKEIGTFADTPGLSNISRYLAHCQTVGALGRRRDPLLLARVILGTSFYQVVLGALYGERAIVPSGRRFSEGLADLVIDAAGPASLKGNRRAPRSRRISRPARKVEGG